MRALPNRFTWGVAILVVLTLALCAGPATYAQSAAFATITGRVVDPGGAAVPNATVTATNAETGFSRTTQTTSDGLFRFDNLTPGIYNVALEASGFTKAEAKNVKLQVGEQRDVNFNLQLAGQKQSVVVTSELPLVETTKTDVSTVIDDKDVAHPRPITSGPATGDTTIITSGLSQGDRVVVNGQYKLRPNSKVTVTMPEPVVAKQARAS